ncbi:uncharacterized protein K452DRAFT_214249, partial [Aplosporella prunicola CBS 121167]
DRDKDHGRSHHRSHRRSDREDREHRHRDRDRREEHRHKHQHQHRAESPRRHASEENTEKRSDIQSLVPKFDEGKDYFVVDRKGDPANLIYGKLHQYSIPTYRRTGYGCVLGLPLDARIDKFASDDRFVVIDDNRRRGRLDRQILSKRPRAREPPTLRLIKVSDADLAQESQLDYLPLPGSKKRKRGSESPEPEEEHVDYRSIEGKAKPSNDPADPDLEYASDEDPALYHDFLVEAKERNAKLSRRVKDEPTNVEAWLDFVEHQEVMIRIGSSDVQRQLTTSEQKALASLRVGIYQEALNSMHSERLLVGLMEESSKVQGRKEYFANWKQILEKNRQSSSLWVKYLDALQTNLAEFQYEECRSKFLDCLKMLCGTGLDSRDSQILRLYIFLRLTTMMSDAGYRERAVALWQALLEFQIFRPGKGLQNDADYNQSLLVDFEDFWESECPRLGEPGAVGWVSSKVDEEYPDPPEPSTEQEHEFEVSDMFDYFAQKERWQMNSYPWPGRTIDEVGEDDPFHVVLFADIEEELGLLQDPFPPTMLVEAFLCFWHLPPLPTSDPLTRAWWLDPFLRDERFYVDTPKTLLLEASSAETETVGLSTLEAYKPPMANYLVTTQELFGGGFFSGERSPDQQEWLRRALKTLANATSEDIVAEYHLAFEWHCNPSGGVAKTAKALLKKRSSSLRLYNAYALIENRTGKSAAANHVFAMALGMSTQLPQDAQKQSILLWRTWIWEALRGDDFTAARHRIGSIGAAKPVPEPPTCAVDEEDWLSPSTVLRVRNILTEGRDHSLSTGVAELGVLYAECLALLAYIQSDSDITPALAVFQQTNALLSLRNLHHSAANEALHQAKCQLLTYHSQRARLSKPSITRSELQESIALFPSNTIFLSVYAANEARFRIDDRVRAIMHDVVLKQDAHSIVTWAFSIHTEAQRGAHLGGTTHAVRAAFERAVESDAGRRCAALWRSYVAYLAARPESAVAAKAVFFRGLLHLPFKKEYLMLAFERLREELGPSDCRRVYNTLQEKELRVRVELDTMLE